ncbi:MAG: asparagine synthase (glutamine-hydrolyzing), partial [Sphingomonadaceae bacterium]
EGCLDRLNGQFAFAIIDRRDGRHRLFLARDRAGILPLFFARDRGRLLFGSEVKALLPALSHSPSLCPVALGQILTCWAPLGSRTPFVGIESLRPGHLMLVEEGRVHQRAWWDWRFPDADGPYRTEPADVLAEELAALLDDAVRLRLRADVTVGAYLSGGLDSSLLSALARRRQGAGLETFSIGFESPDHDEQPHQEAMVRHLDVRHHHIRCSAGDIANALPAAVRHAEMPMVRTAPAPMFQLSGLVRSHGLKVVLTGEGADEIFGGYDLFREAKVRRFWARQPQSRMRPALLARLYPWMRAAGNQPAAHLAAFYGVGLDQPDSPDFSHLPRWRTTGSARMFLSPDYAEASAWDQAEFEALLPSEFGRWHPLARAQYLEATILLPGNLLCAQGDRMLMANSVEGRFPFLDHRVIAFAASLSPSLKLRGLDEKHLLKRAARPFLPTAILARSKQPYRAPGVATVLGTQEGAPLREMLTPDALAQDGIFDARRVGRLVQRLEAAGDGSERDRMALTAVITTQLWCRQFAQQTRKEACHA